MEEIKRISIEEFLTGIKGATIGVSSIITRKYIPVMKKREIIDGIFNILTSVYNENEEKVEGKYDLEINSIMSDIFIKVAIITEYTNIDTSNRLETFDTLSEEQLFDWIISDIGKDATDFEEMFKTRIAEKVAYLKEQELLNKQSNLIDIQSQILVKQSPMDEFFNELTKLVSKLNDVDIKSMTTLLPQLAKLGNSGLKQEDLVKLILANRPKDHKLPKTTKKTTTDKKPRAKKATNLEVVVDVDELEK